jgi:hypothetical protein
MAVVANITFHLWLTTLFNGTTIVPPESLAHDHREYETLSLSLVNTSAIHVREPLPAGQDRIDILLDNLWSSSVDPPSLSFEDIIVSWFSDLLLGSNQATDDTGVDNQMFQAYRLFP